MIPPLTLAALVLGFATPIKNNEPATTPTKNEPAMTKNGHQYADGETGISIATIQSWSQQHSDMAAMEMEMLRISDLVQKINDAVANMVGSTTKTEDPPDEGRRRLCRRLAEEPEPEGDGDEALESRRALQRAACGQQGRPTSYGNYRATLLQASAEFNHAAAVYDTALNAVAASNLAQNAVHLAKERLEALPFVGHLFAGDMDGIASDISIGPVNAAWAARTVLGTSMQLLDALPVDVVGVFGGPAVETAKLALNAAKVAAGEVARKFLTVKNALETAYSTTLRYTGLGAVASLFGGR